MGLVFIEALPFDPLFGLVGTVDILAASEMVENQPYFFRYILCYRDMIHLLID